MEWKLKRRKAFLPGPVLPDDCCVVIEWTDATRAVAASMGDWQKRVASGGEWAFAGCQIRKACSWHVREAREGERSTPWYLPRPYVTAYLLCTDSWTSPPEKGGKGQAAGMGQKRTERNGGGRAPSPLHWPLLRLALACLCRHLLLPLLLQHYYQKCSSVESFCTLPEPLSHPHTSTHPEGYLSIHPQRLAGLAVVLWKKKAARPGGPHVFKNPVLMPVKSM